MNKNQVEGRVKDVTGKVQQEFGKAIGNTNQQVKGVTKQVEGKVQKGVGDVEQVFRKDAKRAR